MEGTIQAPNPITHMSTTSSYRLNQALATTCPTSNWRSGLVSQPKTMAVLNQHQTPLSTKKITSFSKEHWQVTCLQLERNTRIFELRWAFTKLHSISSFCSRGTIIAVCCRRLGVAVSASSCTLIYSGSFKLSLARSWMDFVWVAEKSNVCLCLGSCATIAFRVFLNPTSRIRSASSRTKTCSMASNALKSDKTKQDLNLIPKQ